MGPLVAGRMAGAPGTVIAGAAAGVTVLDDAEAKLVPVALLAVTVKWYVVPFDRPVTSRLVAPAGAG